MGDPDHPSKLEKEVSAIDALIVLLRLGNNQRPFIDICNQRSVHEMDNLMHYLIEKGLVSGCRIEADSYDYTSFSDLTPKGRVVYEKIKQDAPRVFKGEPFFIINPPPVAHVPSTQYYELAPEDMEVEEELEINHDTFFGRTREEREKAQAWIDRTTSVDNAIRSMVEEVYTLFQKHPELNPKSVLEKYREDFEGIAKRVSQEKREMY